MTFKQNAIRAPQALLGLILAVVLAGCQSSQGARSPMEVSASISPDPVVGQAVTLHIEIKTIDGRIMPNTTLTITLPSEVQAANEDLTWSGDIAKDQIQKFDVPMMVTTEGDWLIEVYAYSSTTTDPDSGGFGGLKTLYVHSTASSAQVVEDINRVAPTIPVGQSGPPIPFGSLVPLTPTSSDTNPTTDYTQTVLSPALTLTNPTTATSDYLQQPATETLSPAVEYLAPSDESKTYTDPTYGYSFDYPANWYVTPMDSVAVTNYPLDVYVKGFEKNPDVVRIDIYPQKDMGAFKSFEQYIDNNFDWGGVKILTLQTGEVLENGLQTYKVTAQDGPYEYSLLYVTNGDKVFLMAGLTNTTYSFVEERMMKNFYIR